MKPSLLTGRAASLIPLGAAVGVVVGYLLWAQVFSITATADWSKLITGTELGIQIGAVVSLLGVASPLGWIDAVSPRHLRRYALVYCLAVVSFISITPLVVWLLLQATPIKLLAAWHPAIASHAELPFHFFAALMPQLWWSTGFGLAALGLFGRHGVIPGTAGGFFGLLLAQAMKQLTCFPGGFGSTDAHLNVGSVSISLVVLAGGVCLATLTRLGAAPIAEWKPRVGR